MRVLIAGGAGFIGSHVVERYLEDGWDVTVVDDLSTGRRENLPDGVDLLVTDITSPELSRALERIDFDLLNHHAAQMDVRVSVADPIHDARINLIGLLNLLEIVRARGGLPIIFASSGGVIYGETDVLPTPEQHPKRPFSPYGVAKLASEFYLQYYAVVHGLPYLALRYGNVYGPRQNPEGEAGVVSIFCGKILAGQPLTVFGTGEQTRDFVYVKDVAEANWLASMELSRRDAPPSQAKAALGSSTGDLEALDAAAFNVGTGHATSVLDLIDGLATYVGRELPVRHAAARTGELQRSTLDCSQIERRLGWTARTSLAEGLEATYRYFASEGASACSR